MSYLCQFSSVLAVLCAPGAIGKAEYHIDTAYTGNVALDHPRLYRVRPRFFCFGIFSVSFINRQKHAALVDHSVSCQFNIHDDPTEVGPGQTLRLCLAAPRASEHFPVHVSVRFRTAVEVWQIPYAAPDAASSSVTHPGANRTLCPDLFMPETRKAQKWPPVEVALTTSSVNDVKVCSPIPKDTIPVAVT